MQLFLLFSGANPEPAGPPEKSQGFKEEAAGTGGAGTSRTSGKSPGNSQVLSCLLVILSCVSLKSLNMTVSSQVTQNLGVGDTALGGTWKLSWRAKGFPHFGRRDGRAEVGTPVDLTYQKLNLLCIDQS